MAEITRKKILNEAERCVCGQREEDYGKTWLAYRSKPKEEV